MEVIAILPAFAALAVCLLRSPALAFLNVYLPVLLLIPDHFRWRMPGLPDPTFQNAAILPIALVLPFARRANWRFSLTDLLVLGYAGCIAYSEYRAEGYWEAQNLVLDQVCTVLLPYCLAKILLQPERLGVAFAKRFTLLLGTVAVLSIWEFRMGRRVFFETLWGYFFPGDAEIPVQYRWGFGRIGGPYTHAILAGMIFVVALFLCAWLLKERFWKTPIGGRLVLGCVLLGTLLCMSRGPWIALAIGSCAALFGFVRDRKSTLLKLALLALIVVPPAMEYLSEYSSGSSLRSQTAEERNAAYRVELVDLYMPAVLEQPILGWGSHRVPMINTHPSIDNHYLLLALRHGIPALALLVLTMAWCCARLVFYGAQQPARSTAGALAFTLCGAIASVAVSIATAYLGAQVEPVLFLMLGWSESLLMYGDGSRHAEALATVAVPRPLHSFQRVMT